MIVDVEIDRNIQIVREERELLVPDRIETFRDRVRRVLLLVAVEDAHVRVARAADVLDGEILATIDAYLGQIADVFRVGRCRSATG